MTALVSLRSRLLLSRLAVRLPVDQTADRMEGFAEAGVDLVVMTGGNDPELVAETWQELNSRWGRRVLLAHDLPRASGDLVVTVGGPGGELVRPHPEGLLGWWIGDRRSVTATSNSDFLVVSGSAPGITGAALQAEPPLSPQARPWFLAGDLDLARVQQLIGSGVRRVLLTRIPEPDELAGISRSLREAWRADPQGQAFLAHAIRA